MIVDAILAIVLAPLTWLSSLLPTFTPPSLGLTAGENGCAVAEACSLGGSLRNLAAWVNVPLMLSCMAIVIGAFGVVVTIRLVIWVYDKLPFKAS